MLLTRPSASRITFIDLLCGAGGSSLGLTRAGWCLLAGLNHWKRAIETHAVNFPYARHECVDITSYDMRRLPRARVMWASVICTEATPAGGKKKKRGSKRDEQLELLTEEQEDELRRMDEAGWEQTRATAYDVMRATDYWRFEAVIVENVLEFVTDWPLFGWWLHGMTILGYRHHIVSVNSAHVGGEGNPHAPQWRDRIYIAFVREGIPMPDLEPRPLAHCFECGQDVEARQTWKDTKLTRKFGKVGKYGVQYVYTCPNLGRRHESYTVEPYILPAAAAISWDNLGTKIGSRKRTKDKPEGLKPATMAKIRAGMTMIGEGPTIMRVRDDGRYAPADGTPPMLVQVGGNKRATHPVTHPMPTRMVRETDALVTPAYIVEGHGGGSYARPVDHPLATVLAGGNHHFLTVPDDRIAYGDGHGLVIPYRRGRAKTTKTPLHTVATVESAGLVTPALNQDVSDFGFRMLVADEHLRAQRIDGGYIVTGTSTEQTKQAGNAVSANVAQWLGERFATVL